MKEGKMFRSIPIVLVVLILSVFVAAGFVMWSKKSHAEVQLKTFEMTSLERQSMRNVFQRSQDIAAEVSNVSAGNEAMKTFLVRFANRVASVERDAYETRREAESRFGVAVVESITKTGNIYWVPR